MYNATSVTSDHQLALPDLRVFVSMCRRILGLHFPRRTQAIHKGDSCKPFEAKRFVRSGNLTFMRRCLSLTWLNKYQIRIIIKPGHTATVKIDGASAAETRESTTWKIRTS